MKTHMVLSNSLRMLGAKTYVSRGIDLIEAIKEQVLKEWLLPVQTTLENCRFRTI